MRVFTVPSGVDGARGDLGLRQAFIVRELERGPLIGGQRGQRFAGGDHLFGGGRYQLYARGWVRDCVQAVGDCSRRRPPPPSA